MSLGMREFTPRSEQLFWSIRWSGEVAEVLLDGELDREAVDRFARCVTEIPSGADVLVDLAGVGFLDTTGAGLLDALARQVRATGSSFGIRNARAVVLRTLWVLGLDSLIVDPVGGLADPEPPVALVD